MLEKSHTNLLDRHIFFSVDIFSFFRLVFRVFRVEMHVGIWDRNVVFPLVEQVVGWEAEGGRREGEMGSRAAAGEDVPSFSGRGGVKVGVVGGAMLRAGWR